MAEHDHSNITGVPNYSPKELRRWALVVASVMSFFAVSTILLRVLSRRIRRQPLWWDDYMIMFSMVWNWVVVAVALAMYADGAGYHDSTVGPKAVAHISRYLLVSEVIYIWHMCWTKLSVLLMYYRIFRVPNFKMLVIGVGGFVVIWTITATFLFTFICVPTQKLWYPDMPGHCVSEMGVWLANASSTIFSDFAILLLPIPQVWKLQKRLAERIGLTMVFGLGFFTVFTSSFRVWVLFNYSKTDVSYTLLPLLVWTDIEMCAAVISACLPTLQPCLRVAAGKLGLTCFGTKRQTTNPSFHRTNLQSLQNSAESSRRPTSNIFYQLPDGADMDCILHEETDYRLGRLSTAVSKEGWYTPSTLEMDILEVDTEGD